MSRRPGRFTEAPPSIRFSEPRQNICFYEIAIEDWQYTFSFGLRRHKGADEPDEFYRLIILGTLLRPAKVAQRQVAFQLIPLEILDAANRNKLALPSSIGSFELSKSESHGIARIPLKALNPALVAFSAGRVKYLVAEGEQLRRGKAEIFEVSLQGFLDEGED
jgi:hypothetical protein